MATQSLRNHESEETKPIASPPTSSQPHPMPTAQTASVALRPRKPTSGRRFPTFYALASRRRAIHFGSSIGQSTVLESSRQTSQSVKLSGAEPNAGMAPIQRQAVTTEYSSTRTRCCSQLQSPDAHACWAFIATDRAPGLARHRTSLAGNPYQHSRKGAPSWPPDRFTH
jgi:hypothetical protein